MATGLLLLKTQLRCLKLFTLLLIFDQIWYLINPMGEKMKREA